MLRKLDRETLKTLSLASSRTSQKNVNQSCFRSHGLAKIALPGTLDFYGNEDNRSSHSRLENRCSCCPCAATTALRTTRQRPIESARPPIGKRCTNPAIFVVHHELAAFSHVPLSFLSVRYVRPDHDDPQRRLLCSSQDSRARTPSDWLYLIYKR